MAAIIQRSDAPCAGFRSAVLLCLCVFAGLGVAQSYPVKTVTLMKPRITLLTLGVDDLQKSVEFYRDGLGLPTEGIVGTEFENGAVAFFELQAGLKLALWPRGSIANGSGLPIGPRSPTEFTIAHNVSTKAEADLVIQQVERAGASVLKSAHDTAWGGYAGYFQDPDGHIWEVAWNPQWEIKD